MTYNINMNPPLTKQYPTITLIKKFVEKFHKPDEKIEIDIKQLSGGLSGAIVALVNHSGIQHVVKVDLKEKVINEIGIYQKYLSRKISSSTNSKKELAVLDFPSIDYIKAGDYLGELLYEKDYNDKEYSIHCYSYAKDSNVSDKLYSLDEWIKENTVLNKNADFLSNYSNILDILSEILQKYFYSTQEFCKERNIRKFSLPEIPWGQFLPVASTAASLQPGWIEFLNAITEKWENILSNQEPKTIKYYLSHGDLRCANILIVKDVGNIARPFLIDYGLTGCEHPMYDFARLEVDMVQRVLMLYPEEEIRNIINELTANEDFTPEDWKNHTKYNSFRAIIYMIRSHAKILFDNFPDNERMDTYDLFVLGHSTRMIRNDDPQLRGLNTKYLFLWYILKIFNRVILRNDKSCKLPILSEPFNNSIYNNINEWQLKQIYHGSEERNIRKKILLEREEGPIRLIAHTAHSYLDPAVKRFYDSLKYRLEQAKDNKIQIILLNPFSLEGSKLGIAEARGLLQGPEVDCEYHEKNTELFKRFKTCLKSYKQLREKYPNIELRLTHYSPDATILLSEDHAFIEPYLVGNVYIRYHSNKKMNVPEYLVSKNSDLYKVAEDQFSFFWKRAMSVDEYDRRIEEFKNEFMRSERLRRKIVALHESWIAIDPIVGCPNKCAYCFLTPYKINHKKPFIYRSPEDSYERLKENPWYKMQFTYLQSINWNDARLPIPVACGNYTEMFDSGKYNVYDESSKSYVRETNNINELHHIIENHVKICDDPKKERVPVLCLITKQGISQNELDFIKDKLFLYDKLKIAIFVSISFLPKGIEQGTSEIDRLLSNFENIELIQNQISNETKREFRQIAGIHFWRPLVSGINDDNMMTKIKRIQKAGALSSVAIGLKLSEKLLSYLRSSESKWTEIKGKLASYNIQKKGYELFDNLTRGKAVEAGKKNKHPVYLNTSCAVAHSFLRPDYNATFYPINKLSEVKKTRIVESLHYLGLSDDEFVFHDENDDTFIEIKIPIEQELQTFLRQLHGVEVLVSSNIQSTHEWRGNTSKLTRGEFCINAYCPESQRNICSEYYKNN